MAHGLFQALERVRQLHPALLFLLFLVPIALAYWSFALRPYVRGRGDALLSPWHVRRPAVPGVLERYAAWEWTQESRLTPFGQWVYRELERRHLSLTGLARQARIERDVLLSLLYADPGRRPDPALIRAVGAVLGAREREIERLLPVEIAADTELNA
jgi:hypothetical protein